jgi:hypothetical protein
VADADYRENPAGIRAVLASDMVQGAIRNVCERGQVAAIRNTPVDTGLMAASWRVWVGVRAGRAHGQVYNTAKNPKSGFKYPLAIERGNSRIQRQRPLGRAIDAMASRP